MYISKLLFIRGTVTKDFLALTVNKINNLPYLIGVTYFTNSEFAEIEELFLGSPLFGKALSKNNFSL